MTTRREFLGSIGAAAGAWRAAAQARKPNVVVILADDMGFSDAGCYGGEIETPNIDRLAASGIRFTQAYSTARCGPSRSALLTGYYAQQTASDVMTPGRIPDYTWFLPEYLRPLGYRSYHSGKWHLKLIPGAGGAGFDRSYTQLDEFRYFTQNRHQLDGEPLPKPGDGYYGTIAIADYSIRFLRDHAQNHAGKPFFLYLAFHAPHFPLHALADDIAHYKDKFAEGWDVIRQRRWERMRAAGLIHCGLAPLERNMWTRWNTPDQELFAKIGPGEVTRAVPWASLTAEQKDFQRTKMAIHAAMTTRMDIEIGRVLKQIEQMGAARDTVVLFLSDNGASSEQIIRGDGHDPAAPPGSARSHLCLGPGWAAASNAPFRLYKSWVHEGGIASPLIVHWPNGLAQPNALRHTPCHFVDIVPTVLELAGARIQAAPVEGAPGFDGRSLVPAFEKDIAAVHDFLYFSHYGHRALRMGDWKLVSTGTGFGDVFRDWELYDMARDRSEQVNLAGVHPDLVSRMEARWTALDQEFIRRRENAPPSTQRLLAAAAGPKSG